jgi:hypothetical protein
MEASINLAAMPDKIDTYARCYRAAERSPILGLMGGRNAVIALSALLVCLLAGRLASGIYSEVRGWIYPRCSCQHCQEQNR